MKSKVKRPHSLIALLVLGSLVLSGCNESTPTPDGVIPPALVPYATEVVGTYEGHFISNYRYQHMTVQLSLDEGNRLVLTTDRDPVGEECGIRIGQLESISLSVEESPLNASVSGTFTLDRGDCRWIAGRTVHARVFESEGKRMLHLGLLGFKFTSRGRWYEGWFTRR